MRARTVFAAWVGAGLSCLTLGDLPIAMETLGSAAGLSMGMPGGVVDAMGGSVDDMVRRGERFKSGLGQR